MKHDEPLDDGSVVDNLVDERCDAFELAWRNGPRPSISDFIGPDDEPHRNRLFCELLLVELECRRKLGEQPVESEYLRDFPEFVTDVHATTFRYGTAAFAPVLANGEGAAPDVSKRPGGQIAHFELVERLGAGAMGEAWKAWDTRLKRNVTIKLPRAILLTDNDLQRFLREGRAAAQLSHPQLACVHEIRNEGCTFYIVAGFVEGRNLQQHAAARQLPFGEIVKICASIAAALQHAHNEGVVHRDLKPANIIIDPTGLPHIIDFGLAKLLDSESDLTLNGELVGTPAYMPPELANGDGPKAVAQTDVYSVGVILYELLVGRCPFAGSRSSVISQILACQPPGPRTLRPAIPKDLETICLTAIQKEPEKRYATAQALAEDLQRFADGLPIRARRAGISEKSWRWIRRHPATAVVALLFIAAIVAAGATISSLHDRNKRLSGIRPVSVTTTPPGAQLALVPLDPNTNEPDPDPERIVRPSGTTPLVTELKAGNYLVEAVLPGEHGSRFAEVYRTVSDSSRLDVSLERANKEAGLSPDTCRFRDIEIASRSQPGGNMVQVAIPEGFRKKHPFLPDKLYVDENQTTPADLASQANFKDLLSVADNGDPCISYPSAIKWAEKNQTRLPSSAEYEAIVAAAVRGEARRVATDTPVKMSDVFDDIPEFSTTTRTEPNIAGSGAARNLHGMHVLEGFNKSTELPDLLHWADGETLALPEMRSPKISIRGVRSATPRFMVP